MLEKNFWQAENKAEWEAEWEVSGMGSGIIAQLDTPLITRPRECTDDKTPFTDNETLVYLFFR